MLPTSPIKTFAGCQFNIAKPTNGPEIKYNDWSNKIVEAVKIIKIFDTKNPSRPSIKFMKLIIAVPKIIKKMKNPTYSNWFNETKYSLNNEEFKSINITVNNWKKYLIIEDIPNKSSKNPTIDRGNANNGKVIPKKEETKQLTKTKEIPPPEGIGFICELLSLGITRNFLDKKGIKRINIIQVIIPNKAALMIKFKVYRKIRFCFYRYTNYFLNIQKIKILV